MTKYLHNRPGSENWQIRLHVPNSLQKQLGKPVITRTTGTSDRKAAEVFAMKFIAEQREMFSMLQTQAENFDTFDLNGQIVQRFYQNFLANRREKRKEIGKDANNYKRWCSDMEAEHQEFIRLANIEDYSRLRPIAEGFVKKRGFPIDPKSEEFDSLLKRMMLAVLDAFDVLLREIGGDLEAKPKSQFIQETISAMQNTPKNGERLEDLFEKYAEEEINEKGRKKANVEQAANAISLFIEWIGPNCDILALTKRDATGFREMLSKIPARRGSIKRLKNSSIPKCIQIAEDEGLALLSARTKNRYISDLSGFFNWKGKRGYGGENIWSSSSFDVSGEQISYPPYTNEQLNRILTSPLYSGFLRDGKEHENGEQFASDWRFWIPLICMFTGARITEIAQMFVDDIFESEGHLAGYIKANTKRGQSTKTKLSARLVVFHPILLAAGLKDYWSKRVAQAKQDGNAQLFPELTAYEKRPELGRKPARWWRDYLTKIGIKNGADGVGSHSFRHRLADEMRKAGYLNAEFGLLVMGHSDGSTTSGYGETIQGTVERLGKMIENAEFRGVDFSNILQAGSNKEGSKIATFESVQDVDG